MPSNARSLFRKLLCCESFRDEEAYPPPVQGKRSRASTYSTFESKSTKRTSRGRSPTPRHSMMGPTLHCVRHAQGYHNLSEDNSNIHDPRLTPKGEEQCRILREDFPHSRDIDLIVASPITRTIQTALIGFDDAIKKKKLRVIALPELQEVSDDPCDTGSEPPALEKEFDGKPVDLNLVKPGWNDKTDDRWASSKEALERRALRARCWLRDRPEKNIAVVTHGSFLHYLTEDFSDTDRHDGTGWANTEFRSYGFSSSSPDQAHLVETVESSRKRRGPEQNGEVDEKENLQRGIDLEEKSKNQTARAQMLHEKIKINRRDEIGAYA